MRQYGNFVYMAIKEPQWLDPLEEQAWRAFRRLTIAVTTATERDLAQMDLSGADYEVLSTLSEQDDASSPLGRQAEKMGWSRSRLSRHTSRMQARGLITRHADASDGRGCILRLTDQGLATLRDAAPHHVDSVRRHFIDRLDAEGLRSILTMAERVLRAEATG